jgi:hypothetical protein
MGIMDGFLKQLATGDRIHDYQHANKIFASDGFRSAPKHAFLFYVRVSLNGGAVGLSQDSVYPSIRVMELGSLCKTAELPKFQIETKLMNAYNRPYSAMTKMKYENVRLTFHDDADDNLIAFWYNYYSYYFRDSDYNESVYQYPDQHKNRQATMWGFNPAKSSIDYQQLIKKVDIFTFHNNRFTQYSLMNPKIAGWNQNQLDYSQHGGIMEHQVTLNYEAVKYQQGYVTPDQFPDMMLRYDRTPSPLDPAGGGSVSVLGRGGAVETANSVLKDLASGNFAGAALKAARAFQTWKGSDLTAVIKSEGTQVLKDIISGKNPLSSISVPSLGSLTNSLSTGGPLGKAAAAVAGAIGAGAAALGFGSQTGSVASLTNSSPVAGIGVVAQNFLSGAQSTSGAIKSNGSNLAQAPAAAQIAFQSIKASFPSNFTI